MTHPTVTQALLPCPNPWCEGHIYDVQHRPPLWRVCCACGVSGPTTYREDSAIAAWNTRATEASTAARIAVLEAENTALAAGACINPGQHALVGDEHGNSICTAYEALMAEERAHSEALARIAALEGALAIAADRLFRAACILKDEDLPKTGEQFDGYVSDARAVLLRIEGERS